MVCLITITLGGFFFGRHLAKMGSADTDDFIQGMQGYQWTDADLEFVYLSKQQKRAQQLRVNT